MKTLFALIIGTAFALIIAAPVAADAIPPDYAEMCGTRYYSTTLNIIPACDAGGSTPSGAGVFGPSVEAYDTFEPSNAHEYWVRYVGSYSVTECEYGDYEGWGLVFHSDGSYAQVNTDISYECVINGSIYAGEGGSDFYIFPIPEGSRPAAGNFDCMLHQSSDNVGNDFTYVRPHVRSDFHVNYYCGSEIEIDRVDIWLEEPDIVNYCPDGTEVLDDPVDIPKGATWTDVYTTTYDALQVRYTLTRTDAVAPSYLHGTAGVNRAFEDFNEFGSPISVTVPTTVTYVGPITGTPGVHGPVADMSVENTGGSNDDDFTLLSACILEADAPDLPAFCRDGYEVLGDGPVYVERGWDGSWEETNINPWGTDEVAATISILQTSSTPSAWVYADDSVSDRRMWIVNWQQYTDNHVYSITVPLSHTIAGGFITPVDMEVVNMGIADFSLRSVCIRPTEQISAPLECNLRNHDFITSTVHWDSKHTTLSWLDADGSNGAADSEPSGQGVVYQQDFTNVRGLYELSARIRSTAPTTEANVTLKASHLLHDNERVSASVESDWTLISGDVYLRAPYEFSVESSGDIQIDWVCISESTTDGENGWRPEIPVCEFPTFDDHPAFSITNLLMSAEEDNWFYWLSTKISALLVWLECEIERIINTAVSMIIDVLQDIGLPSLPDDISIGSLILWLRRSFEAFGSWLVGSWSNFIFSGRTMGEWLGDQLIAIGEWFWEDILLELIEWIMDQLQAAGVIGTDTAQRVMWMFRNIDIWLAAAADEIEYELGSATQLLSDIVTIFDVMIAGLQTGLTGEQELDMGEDLGGFASYLWRGVAFIDQVVDGTPLIGLNVVAMGIIFWGLATWSLKRLGKMLEFISSSL